MKALLISVGTGTRASKRAVESLAEAIAKSINHHNPDKVFFVVTKQSLETTVPKILPKIESRKYDIIQLVDPDNIQSIYETLKPKIREIKNEYQRLIIDYTSGTKAMTAALAVLATIFEVDELSYITGKRKAGIVQHGTEQIVPIRPYFISAEQKIKTAIEFFNRNQFSATVTILKQIKKTIRDPEIIDQIEPLLQLAEAYEKWDKFHHEKAYKLIRKIKIPELAKNKQFLGQLASNIRREGETEPYYIADLINNAKRRSEEAKYDDAVARLYRTIELIAQYRLKKDYGIADTSKVEIEKIPKELLRRWRISKEEKTVRLALERDYELLSALGDPMGHKYQKDKRLKNLLKKRNMSILAHGQTPVTRQVYIQLNKKVMEYAKEAVENIGQFLENSKFIKWRIVR